MGKGLESIIPGDCFFLMVDLTSWERLQSIDVDGFGCSPVKNVANPKNQQEPSNGGVNEPVFFAGLYISS